MPFYDNRYRLLFFTIAFMLLGAFVGSLSFLIFSPGGIQTTTSFSPLDLDPQSLRLAAFTSHLLTFAVPGFIALYLCYRGRWWKSVNPLPFPGRLLGQVIIFSLVALPLVGLSVWINLQIPLPDWAMQPEEQTSAMLAKILSFNGPGDLATALLAVAVAAGVGEELIFRGILQGKVLGRLNHHAAIWIAAAVFSLIHLELAGFLPRMFLGAILGYVFHWSGSLLVAMLLHVLFNGIQVVTTYLSGVYTPDTEAVELPQWYLLVGSAILTFGIGYYLEQQTKRGTPNDD